MKQQHHSLAMRLSLTALMKLAEQGGKSVLQHTSLLVSEWNILWLTVSNDSLFGAVTPPPDCESCCGASSSSTQPTPSPTC